MTCPKCGKEIIEGSKFCTACGFKVADDYRDAQDFYDKAPSASGGYNDRPEFKAPEPVERNEATPPEVPVFRSSEDMNTYREIAPITYRLPKDAFLEVFKSKAFIVLIVSLCLYAVLFAVGAFGPMSTNLFKTLSDTTGGMLSDNDIMTIINDMRIGTVIGGIIELLPMILAIIALFMINSARYDRPLVSGGFGVGRAYAIIMMIINIIIYGLIAAGFILIGIFTYAVPEGEFERMLERMNSLLPGMYKFNISGFMLSMIATLFFTIAGIMIVVMVFRIIYYAKMQSSIKKMRECCAESEVNGRYPSAFVGVYAIIIAAFSFLSVPFMMSDYVSGIAQICFIASRISFAVLIFTFRKTMKMSE